MNVIGVAQGAHPTEVAGIVHGHSGGTLHERLDDQCGDAAVMLLEQRTQLAGGAPRHIAGRLLSSRLPSVGRHDLVSTHQQRVVRVAEHRDVGNGQRTERFAVVALAQADEFALVCAADVAPVVEAHLQRDFDRRSAVARVEAVAERVAGRFTEAFGKLHGRRMRAARQHHVRQTIELISQGVLQADVAVAEQVDPPRIGGVEVAPTLEVLQPGTVATCNGQRRDPARKQPGRHWMSHAFTVMPHGAQHCRKRVGGTTKRRAASRPTTPVRRPRRRRTHKGCAFPGGPPMAPGSSGRRHRVQRSVRALRSNTPAEMP